MLPKIESFHKSLLELEVDVSIVTETWLNNVEPNDQRIMDFQDSADFSIIRRGRRGGGAAIVFDRSKLRLLHAKHEIVAAIGRRGQRRKVLVVGLYIPPGIMRRRTKVYTIIPMKKTAA